MGRVTAKAAGTALVFVSTVCCSIADTVAVEVARQELPSGVWYEQTWEFGAANTLETVPNNSWWGVGKVGPGSSSQIHAFGWGSTLIQWDATPAGIDPTGSRSAKITFGPNGSSGGPQIYLPDANTDKPQEIWHEQWIKYESDWGMMPESCEGSPINGHKTIFWFAEPTVRHEFHIGHQGNTIQWFNNGSTRPEGRTDGQVDEPTEVWDGQWHRWRFYLKQATDGRNGGYKLWFDDKLLHDHPSDEPMMVNAAETFWNHIFLSANMNCPPPDAQSMWFGRTRIYVTNPGW